MEYLRLATALLLLGVCIGQTALPTYSYPSCAAKNTTKLAPGVPGPIPNVPYLPDSFQTRVEANIIDKNYTMVAEEYYDSINKLSAIRTITNNTEDYMVFDYKNNQLLYDVNGQCYTKPLQTDDNSLIFGLHNTSGGAIHVYSTSGALHFAKQNGLTYMGITSVRGIQVDHWQSCMYWAMLYSNFTLDYYFSRPSWKDSVNFPSIPVRAEVTGLQIFPAVINFHHIYEYFDFRSKMWADNTVFETPAGQACKGRKQTRVVPTLGAQYSYREEIISPLIQQVSEADIWYDYTYKLVRFDYRPGDTIPPFNARNPVTEIHDYSTGIAYAIDRVIGNCSIIPIENATFDAHVNVSQTLNNRQQFTIKMKTPGKLFYLDKSYTYEGQRPCRNMMCDVFISTRSDFSLSGYQPFNSTFVFYFLSMDWMSSNNVGKSSSDLTDIPVQLDITTPNRVGYSASYNIYDFNYQAADISQFDVTSCFDDFSKLPIRIDFQGSYDQSLYPYKSAFLKAAIDQLAQTSHFSPIRIQKTEFHMTPNNAYFLATLTDVPPAISFYRRVPGMYQLYSNDKSLAASSPADCATACNAAGDLPCNSFDFCPGKNLCTLSKTHTEDGNLAPSQSQCDHYSRTTDRAAFELSVTAAWRLIRDVVIAQDFILNVPLNGQTKKFVASSVSDSVVQNGQRQISSKTLMSQFKGQINKALPGYDDLILTGQAIDDCAASCINREDWKCNSFEFCFDSGYCILSKVHPDTMPTKVVNKQFCDLYSRSYTSDYNQVPGQTLLSNSDVIYENVYSPDLCAQMCNNYVEFPCKSFDYCSDVSTCFLGRTHYYDVPKADIQASPMCNHYSRNYINDFKKTVRSQIANRDDRIISGIPVEQCAKLCVEEETFSCASFDYCGNTTQCRLSTASMKNIGQVSITKTLWCDVYNRESFPDGTAYVNNPSKYYSLPATNTGYTSGAMAGLALGMLLLGLLVTFGGIFAYSKFKGVPMDNMKISFVKDSDS